MFERDYFMLHFTDGVPLRIKFRDTDDVSYDNRFEHPTIRVVDSRRNRWFYEVQSEVLARKIEDVWRTSTAPRQIDRS